MTIGTGGIQDWPAGGWDRPQNLVEAAAAFEALLIGQLFKTAWEAAGGDDLQQDGGAATMLEIATEYLAGEVARQGGFGLARMIAAQLEQDRGAGSDKAKPQKEEARGL